MRIQTRWMSAVTAVTAVMMLGAAACEPGRSEAPAELAAKTFIDEDGKRVLPNWSTDEEAAIAAQALESPLSESARVAPNGSFRVPAEYEPISAVVMTYTGFRSMVAATAKAVAEAGAEAWVVGGPSSISGVRADQYRRLNFNYDTVWARDYGPVGLNETTGEISIIDSTYRHYASRRADDAIPCNVANTAGGNCYKTSLILDGGNFLIDTKGNLFFTERTYDWNSRMSKEQVDEELRQYYGAKTLHPLPYAKSGNSPADGTGHLDMFVKLVNDCRVLVAQTNNAPFKAVTDYAANYFANLECPEGRPYEVVRVDGWSSGGVWYTYTNSLIVNDSVIIPSYSSGDNAKAVAAYQQAMPGTRVVPVNSDQSITMGGSIHCVTQTLPTVASVTPPETEPTEPTPPTEPSEPTEPETGTPSFP